MAVRLAPTIADDEPRKTARVKRVAAEYFDADESHVRRLIRDGELESHVIGKRGVRVYLDSVADYQRRKTKAARPQKRPDKDETPTPRPKPSRAARARHEAAVASLQKTGFLR